jgi:hypothetical protein
MILAAMMCGSPCATDLPFVNEERQERIETLNLVVMLSEANFQATLLDKRPRGNLFKRSIDLAVASETRLEWWIFGSTKIMNASRSFLANR